MSRPDKLVEILSTPSHRLTPKKAFDKLSALINLYHSIEYRYSSEFEKEEFRVAIRSEVKKLKKRLGTAAAANSEYWLADREAWNSAKESLL